MRVRYHPVAKAYNQIAEPHKVTHLPGLRTASMRPIWWRGTRTPYMNVELPFATEHSGTCENIGIGPEAHFQVTHSLIDDGGAFH